MKIELIDQKTVKIVLNESDLDAFSFDKNESSVSGTKRLVLKLIGQIREETSLDLTGGKLFIEAFPDLNGGCILYVNIIERERKTVRTQRTEAGFGAPLLFRFDVLDHLIGGSTRLFSQYSHLIRKSSLYLLGKEYFLVLSSYLKADEKLIRLLGEYGRFFGKGEVRHAFLKEHARCLVEGTAVETLTELSG